MRPIAVRAVKITGVISGVLLAWLVQPLFLPPFTARARIAVEPGELPELAHRAGTILNVAARAYAWQKPGYRGPRSQGFGTYDGKQDELQVFVTASDRESALAILNDWTARMLQERPGLRVLAPPTRDRFEAPNLLALLVGAVAGWWAATQILDGRSGSGELPDWAD